MSYFLKIVKEIILSNHYMWIYVIILLSSIFQGKMSTWYAMKGINKITSSRYKIVEELRSELIEKLKTKEKLTDYYNCCIKYGTYLALGIISFGQLVGLYIANNVDRISMTNRINISVCMFTMTISIMEYRDNKRISEKMTAEINIETSQILEEYEDLEDIARKDFVLDKLVKLNRITEEQRLEFIKKNKNDKK